ncbi:hypothetical protein KCP69_12380 [Salmonella enterica subsp. enterica]|nr:hypothetical protein KCP69_12380 [Salmonella enterica subsp. enterica]
MTLCACTILTHIASPSQNRRWRGYGTLPCGKNGLTVHRRRPRRTRLNKISSRCSAEICALPPLSADAYLLTKLHQAIRGRRNIGHMLSGNA